MTDNNEQDLIEIKKQYEELQEKYMAAWGEFNKWKEKMREIDSQMQELDEYKKPYIVRIYQEIYKDVEMDAFSEQDAAEAVLDCVDDFVFEDIEHFSSREPRVKVLCLSEDYKAGMEDKDEQETEKD